VKVEAGLPEMKWLVFSKHPFRFFPSPMFTYSKLAQAGIAAVSYLAGVAAEGRLAGSAEIAEDRQLSRMLVAKILTMLSRAGLVEGKPGPTGGYRLARPASEITLLDVVKVFEDPQDTVMCPFGPNWCGVGPVCPLHYTLLEMHQQALDRLARENFAQFQKHSK
jgi:Rrf2 family transcriptional regulator, iron-sulfur cluster assembly transcription factor